MSQCLCCSHVQCSLAHQPALTCSCSKRWLHHLLRPRQARHFPPLFGHSSARLSSSFRRPASKQSKVLAGFHFINTHYPHHQAILDPPLLFPSARLFSATASSTLSSNTHITPLRPPSPNTLRAFQRVLSAALPLPTRGRTTTPLSTWLTQPTRIFLPTCKHHC